MPSLELMPCINGLEAPQKMPRGHGKVASNAENVADRRNHTLLRRSLDQNNYKFSSKEHQISALVLRNSERRCTIFTLVALELDAYWKLVTFLSPLQGSDKRNHLGSGAHSGVDGLKSISSPAIIFQIGLQKEQSINLPESTCSPKSASACSSSGTLVMGQSRNRNKRPKSVKGSCLILDNSSGSLCDSLSAVGSDVLVNDIPKVDNPVKRSSRKKGKKKRKQYKRPMCKNISTELEGQYEESTCGASVVETSVNSAPFCSGEHMSENNLSENATSHSLPVEDITIEKDDNEIINNDVNSLTTMISCISYSDEMDEAEPVASLSLAFACEEFSCINSIDLNSKSSTPHCPERILSTVDVNIKNSHPKQNNNCNDHLSSISLGQYYDDPVLDPFQDCWNSDISENCINDVETRLSIKDKSGLNFLGGMVSDSRNFDPSFHRTTVNSCAMSSGISNDCYTSNPYWSEDVHKQSSAERAQCSNQACSSNDFHSVISGKRGRTARKVTARTGKDNNYLVWQKVQKMDTEHCINEQKNVYVVSPRADIPPKDSDTRVRLNTFVGLKQNQRGKTGRYPCSYEMVSQTSETFSFKVASSAVDSSETNVKRKPSSAAKQLNHYSKGSHDGTVNIARPSKVHVQQKKGLKILPQGNHKKHNSTELSSSCSTDSPLLVVKPTEKIDFRQSEQRQETREYMDEATSSGLTCSTACEMTSSTSYNQTGPLLTAMDSLGPTHIEVHSDSNSIKEYNNMHEDLYLMDTAGNQCRKLQAECSHAGCNEPDNSFGPVLQKWVPVGRKDTVMSHTSHIDNLTASVIDESVPNKLDTKNGEAEVNLKVNCFLPLTGRELRFLSPSTEHIDCSCAENDKLAGKLRSHPRTVGEFGVLAESNCHLTHEVKDQGFSGFETDLGKIIHAVNDACKLQAAAEVVHLVTGSPVAEFERFIRSASPVISQRYHRRGCTTCSGEQLTSNSLCLHQIHNTCLGSLWQWYEVPGCYGLEVKAEDNRNPKRLRNGFLEFSAYFVPYLSAVQLFGRSGTSYASSSKEVMLSCEVDKASKSSSYLCSLPIFSKLVPQPRKEVDACVLGSSSSAKGEFFNQSVRQANLSDEELIFEYFEHVQPPQRRPLFEKIKELVSGDTSSSSQIYGDPVKLECLNLHDLHPASWYSVAWYPIYRIPDGNFRAAFLTYHSLGHYIHQSASSIPDGDFTRIVSPVVGLQSYNAKRECWFQPRGLESKEVQTEEASISNPAKILEERLRTLEHTASVMATAKVCKGNQRSVNNHPDYNHFFSRW